MVDVDALACFEVGEVPEDFDGGRGFVGAADFGCYGGPAFWWGDLEIGGVVVEGCEEGVEVEEDLFVLGWRVGFASWSLRGGESVGWMGPDGCRGGYFHGGDVHGDCFFLELDDVWEKGGWDFSRGG